MKIKGSHIKIMGLAMGLPSLILGAAYLFMSLAEQGVISQGFGVFLLMALVGNCFFWIFYFAKSKN